jgi:hypothetical protein
VADDEGHVQGRAAAAVSDAAVGVVELIDRRRFLLASLARTLVAISVLATVGCARTPSIPKTVTHLGQIVGSWDGWIDCHGCTGRFRGTMIIRDDGMWTLSYERNPTYHGKSASWTA